MNQVSALKNPISRSVDALTEPNQPHPFGFVLKGAKAGPQLVIGGHGWIAEATYDRLRSIPTLPWMRGNLVLVRFDLLSDGFRALDALADLGPTDRTVHLTTIGPFQGADPVGTNTQRVLRAARDLGMIEGRGVR